MMTVGYLIDESNMLEIGNNKGDDRDCNLFEEDTEDEVEEVDICTVGYPFCLSTNIRLLLYIAPMRHVKHAQIAAAVRAPSASHVDGNSVRALLEHEVELVMLQLFPGVRGICEIPGLAPNSTHKLRNIDEIGKVTVRIAVESGAIPIAQQEHRPLIPAIHWVVSLESDTHSVDR
eukprot:2156176-Rhodomonas_salina.4